MTRAFHATEEEIRLAIKILASLGLDTDTGVLQGEQAREIFTRSALPPCTLRDIWNISDTNGNGELSKHEITMALRLIGWIQSGESLRSELLAKVGPFPTLDGFSDIEYKRSRQDDSVPQIMVFPAVSEEQLRNFMQSFIDAGPLANGFVNGDRVLDVYLSSNLSYEIIQDIINLVARTSQTSLTFSEFACGLYLIQGLKSSQLHGVPSDLPPDLFDQFQEPPSESLQRTEPGPPKVMTPDPSRTLPSASPSTLTKKQPPPVPPKRRDSLLKGPHSPPAINAKFSAKISLPPPQLSPSSSNRLVERSPTFDSTTSSISLPNSLSSPFEDPMEHQSETQRLSKIPESRSQSLPVPLQPPPPPPLPPPEKETLNKLKGDIQTLSKQVESLLSQLEEQKTLRETNEALRLENEILKTQVKDTERMMSEVLSANESESVGSQEQFAHEITRLMGELEEKETQCADHHRRIAALSSEERELREKLRESEGTLAKSITEVSEFRRVVDSKKEEIEDLKGRLSVLTKEVPDRSGSGESGGMSYREMKVFIKDVTKENEGLKGQVRDMERSMEQLLLSTRHAKFNEIEGENRKLRMQVRELESVVTQLQSSVSPSASQVQQVDKLAKENGKLKSQLQDGKRAYADYRSTSETKIVGLEQKLEALKQENTRLKVDIHAATEGRREEGTLPPPGYDEPFVTPP